MKRRAARGVAVNDAHHQLGKLLGVNVHVLSQGRKKKESGQPDPNFYSDRARMHGLRNLARAVFRTRNARGMPKKYRVTVKSAAHPELRLAIKHVRQARDALRVGNIGRFDHMRDKAQKHLMVACKHFCAPAMGAAAKQQARMPNISAVGGKARAEAYAQPELERLIRAAVVQHNGPMSVEAWVEEFPLSRAAIYRRIARIKKEL
ncbi:MAG: hypothetical protein WKH97_02385 [Casimicrobiaceae bacterium]